MAKQSLRAQMDAARAAAAFIGAAQEEPVEEKQAAPKKTASASVPTTDAPVAHSTPKGRRATAPAPTADDEAAVKPKAARTRRQRPKTPKPDPEPTDGANSRMTAQVLVPMTAEQREHADLLASVMKITRAEVMRQALDEYWDHHKAELQAAVAAYEQLIRELMK